MWRGELACRTGFTRSKSITVHAAVGPTTVPIQGGGAGRERKKAQIFNLINIINRLNRLREEFFFMEIYPPPKLIFCYQLFLKLRILFILVDISSFFFILFFYLSFFSFFNSFYNIEIVLEIQSEYSNLSANSKKKNNFNYRGIGLIFLKILKFADRLN